MSAFEIGIIGGNGAMGRWFTRFFRNAGFTVQVADRSEGMGLPELAARCAVVVVAVPIGAASEVIRTVGPLMREDQLLTDITSLKIEPMRTMLEASPSEVVGLHPLFGPDTPALDGQNVVVCPGRGERWRAWITDILAEAGARLTEASPEKHDEIMSIVQGLAHLNTMLMGLVLKEAGFSEAELERFSTPVFRRKMAMIEKVFDQNPQMYAEIIACNTGIEKIVSEYEKSLDKVTKLIRNSDTEGLTTLLASGVKR